jgi:hypothetical protein
MQQPTLARLSTPSEQQAVSHPVPARDAADRLASLQGLFDKANLLVVTPSPPTPAMPVEDYVTAVMRLLEAGDHPRGEVLLDRKF